VTAPRPLRTALLVAACDGAAIGAAVASEADALYLDLEAGVPVRELPTARATVRSVVASEGARGRAVVARVNSVSSGLLEDDLAAVVVPGLYAVMLPKIATPADVVALDEALARHEAAAGIVVGETVVHPVIETAQAVRLAYEIASASARVAHMGGVAAPAGDLARAIGFEWTPGGDETLFIRSRLLVEGRAAGVRFPISGLPVREDLDEARAIAMQARHLGYEGLLIGYAAHAPIVNEVFTPTDQEVRRWQRLVDAAGTGSFRGRRLDPSTVEWARAKLEGARVLRGD
jgi:citrate lyase subunit beta/citryl-CoA lyase